MKKVAKKIKKTRAAKPKVTMPKLYKVTGANGESIHGGSLTWSLPKDGKPGAWAEVTGEIRACERGLHLVGAKHLLEWVKSGCRIFEVEAEGVIGDAETQTKVVASRVRLVREIENEKVGEILVLRYGVHEVKSGVVLASGSSTVTAYDSSTVTAVHKVVVVARWGSATVSLENSAVFVDQRGGRPVVRVAGELEKAK